MSIVINPSVSLGFNRPLTQNVKSTVALTNPGTQPIAFKVKTTAPKLYCVRPNSGKIESGQTVEVQVMLQAMKDEPPLSAKCKDKFLIQSTVLSADKDTANTTELWSGEIEQHKIRVVYLPPEGQTVPEEDESHLYAPSKYETVRGGPVPTNGDADQSGDATGGDVTAPEPEVHVDAPSTPPQQVLEEDMPHVPPPPPEEEPEEEMHTTPLVNVNVHQPSPPTPPPMPVPAPAPPVVLPVGPDPSDELTKKLDEAHAEIERLRVIISSMPPPSTVGPTTTFDTSTETDTGLGFRRRSGPRSVLSDDDASTVTPTEYGSLVDEAIATPEGVPLQVVIIIALGVFITTYLFF